MNDTRPIFETDDPNRRARQPRCDTEQRDTVSLSFQDLLLECGRNRIRFNFKRSNFEAQ